MIFSVILPEIVSDMACAQVQAVYAAVGDELKRGGKILDLKVDLSATFEHDCPPVSYYRLAARDRVWVRQVLATPGQAARVGETLVVCSTAPDESLEGAPHEPARLSIVSIVGQTDGWT